MTSTKPSIYQKISEAVQAIKGRTSLQPKMGIILGSGLGSVAASVQDAVRIPYTEIPYFHGTSIEGHSGFLVVGNFQGVPTVFLSGRFHRYEGYDMEDVVFPTRTVCGLGIETLILTNAAGGINTRFRPGQLMLIQDHINLMGDNPLRGPNLAEMGPRFPDLSEAYHRGKSQILIEAAQELGIGLHTGVYAGVLGPTYETPAEIRMLRTLGADAVGMSTVPETIAANHLGVAVAGVSCISNLAAGMTNQKVTHDEVMENSKLAVHQLTRLIETAVPRMIHRP
jgi:purine-nucleoside phosphorylase